MQSSKLKNIVLIILLITNLFLLFLLASQRLESRQLQRRTLSDVVALLSDQGISVDPSLLPDSPFPTPLQVSQDSQWEREVFSALLGEDTQVTQRGLVSFYRGSKGSAEVRGDGAFSVSFADGAYPTAGDPTALGGQVLELLGIQGILTAQGPDSLTYLECCSVGEALPIFSCQTTLTFSDQALTALAGTRLVGSPVSLSTPQDTLSLATLLVRFRTGLLDSGNACTAITAATQGYTLSTDSSGTLRLTPALRVDTDTGAYLLNALTGELTRL